MTSVLNPGLFRSTTGEPITRDNIDALLDAGRIQVAMSGHRWWSIRRNGATKRWKRDPMRIRVPFRYGFKGQASIDEHDFTT